MPDIPAIASVLSSLKTATDIAKLMRQSDLSFEAAEYKLKFAELTSALADIKLEVVEVQEEIARKDKRIADLEAALCTKEEVIRYRDAYYKKDENNQPVGRPYCMRCWNVEHKLFELHTAAGNRHVRQCTSCKSGFDNMLTQELKPKWYEGVLP